MRSIFISYFFCSFFLFLFLLGILISCSSIQKNKSSISGTPQLQSTTDKITEIFSKVCPAPITKKQTKKSNELIIQNEDCALFVFPFLNQDILKLIHPWMEKITFQNLLLYLDIYKDSDCLKINGFYLSKDKSLAWYWADHPKDNKDYCKTDDYKKEKIFKKREFLESMKEVIRKKSSRGVNE
jgi:hypothetical protein